MNSEHLKLIITDDGSHSILNLDLNEIYHSKYGAFQESEYVYIQQGLIPLMSELEEINIFEFGFGTGSNLFLTMHAALNKSVHINYETIEKYPLPPSIYNLLNYPQLKPHPEIDIAFKASHSAPWNFEIPLLNNFTFIKWQLELNQYNHQRQFDLVYFDAFAPIKQPEVWTEQILATIYNLMKPNAKLVTYCAKSSFKKTLRNLGFELEKLKGPPHKMEMTRATKLA